MTRLPDYDKEFKKKIKNNFNEVISLLDEKEEGMVKKVATFSSNFDFRDASVKSKIRRDKIFRAHFAKDPGKQNIYQALAAKYIQNIKGVKNFVSLGNNAKVVSSGAVMTR